jgi:RNA recognition motif-containing protein
MVDPHTNESRLFAFVDMATHDDMERAMAKLHRSELDGRTISVEKV